MSKPETTRQTAGWGPWRRDWYSICSAHTSRQADCDLCQTGRWINRWGHLFSSAVYRLHRPTWIWWANRPNSKQRRWLESVFPNLKGH